jgi:hypothetical protein
VKAFGVIALGLLLGRPAEVVACSVVRWPVPSALSTAQQLTISSEWIVRATATDYARRPSNPDLFTTGQPDSLIRFRVDEVLKGTGVPKELAIAGYLFESDDFNDHPAPYDFVRPGGRAGSCFANSYRRGAPHLLMLRKDREGHYTPYWSALDPVNEQLRSENDDWITWVRNQVYEDARTAPRLEADRMNVTYAVYSAVIRGLESREIAIGQPLPDSLGILGRTAVPVDHEPYREPGSPLPISRELQIDFANSIVLQDPLLPKFDIQFPYQIVPVPRSQQYRSSPARPLLAFSQVGVDPAATNAIVYFSYQCSYDCGTGGYVVLEKRTGGWRIVRVIDAWKVKGAGK